MISNDIEMKKSWGNMMSFRPVEIERTPYGINLKATTDLLDNEISKIFRKMNLGEAKAQVDMPERYIINKGATILFWKNGEKTIVKRCEEDEFNPRLAFLTAFFQRYSGMSKNKANKFLANLQVEESKKEEPQEKIKQENDCKYKFKIGDRVRAMRTNGNITEGWTGTIDELDNTPFVRWDNGGYHCEFQDYLEKI